MFKRTLGEKIVNAFLAVDMKTSERHKYEFLILSIIIQYLRSLFLHSNYNFLKMKIKSLFAIKLNERKIRTKQIEYKIYLKDKDLKGIDSY